MERLTKTDKVGTYLVKCRENPCENLKGKCGSCAYMQQAIERLAEYESLELTPEQIKEIDKLYREKCEELSAYKNLEEQGKLVLFPTYAYFIKNNKVYKGWVQEATHCVYRKPLYDIRYDDNSLANYRGYVGVTVFLTKEEAEQKLKELQEKKLW